MDVKSQSHPKQFLRGSKLAAVLGRSAIAGALALALGTANANSAEIKVVSGPEMARVLTTLAPRFERLTKHTLVIELTTQAGLKQRLDSGEPFDVAVVDQQTAGRLLQQGTIAIDGMSCVAWSRLGIAVRAGAAKPDTGTADQLRGTLLGARSIAFSGKEASGAYFRDALAWLGISPQIEPKLIDIGNGNPLELVARGDVDLGVMLASDIASFAGVEELDPMPAEIQALKPVFATLATKAPSAAAARRLIAFLSTFNATKVIHANGMDTSLAE
jgi:molybdate transport system substrate-binding protein